MASSNGRALRDLRNLKIEECALIDIISDLKIQLNRLKVEELAVSSKIRQRKMDRLQSNPCTTVSALQSQVVQENPDFVNKVDLNLSTAGSILNKLALGGTIDSSDQDEEDEDSSEEMDDAPSLAFRL